MRFVDGSVFTESYDPWNCAAGVGEDGAPDSNVLGVCVYVSPPSSPPSPPPFAPGEWLLTIEMDDPNDDEGVTSQAINNPDWNCAGPCPSVQLRPGCAFVHLHGAGAAYFGSGLGIAGSGIRVNSRRLREPGVRGW